MVQDDVGRYQLLLHLGQLLHQLTVLLVVFPYQQVSKFWILLRVLVIIL